jgi:16S rRNA (adenine1518-N6/adenine1519-N6)-dimethyltransferase
MNPSVAGRDGAMRDEGTDPLDARHLGPETVRRYLHRHGLAARRRLSQNHLADGLVLEAILEAAEIVAGRRVLEIGPGIGILTGELLRAGAAVTAVEVDGRLVAHLRERFAGALERTEAAPGSAGSLRLVEGDVLDLGADGLAGLVEPPWDAVANLPYHITSPVLHLLLGGDLRPERFVLMLQHEVADRIAAPPGGMSYVSVFVQYHAAVQIVRVVPAASFEPAPEVDSAVLAGTVRARRLEADAEEQLWRLVQAGFRERRKMLHNVLSRQLPAVGRARVGEALAATGIAPDRRPQELSVEQWIALSAAIGPLDRAGAPA